MASDYPPYMNKYGVIPKVLEKIKTAATPERFTQDYLKTKLGFNSGNYMPFIPFAKRIGLIQMDGTPSDLYRAFRNPNESGKAMAKMIRRGYAELFTRNEYMHELDRPSLEGLLIEACGLEPGSGTLRSIIGSLEGLKTFARFDAEPQNGADDDGEDSEQGDETGIDNEKQPPAGRNGLGLNLAYSINLVLPKTADVAVFNAIFKSLRANLLNK
jgi:hypothetical protein